MTISKLFHLFGVLIISDGGAILTVGTIGLIGTRIEDILRKHSYR